MKQLLIILVLSAMANSAGARINVAKPEYGRQAASKTGQRNTLSNTKPGMKGDSLVFEGLPKNNIDYYVIGHGKVVSSGKLSRVHNTLCITRLLKGAYTIALKQGGSIKVFGWLEEVVVR